MTHYLLSGVQQWFGRRKALDIDHLALSGRDGCALLGPNGSGKTTLLRILALLTPPTRGRLTFMGKALDRRRNRLLPRRRKVVLVDQHPIMFSTTVLKNTAFGPKARGMSKSERLRLAMACLERVGMSDFADRPAHRLSGGETRRVAIARALACRPEILLLDEPTAEVDVENQAVVEKIILDILAEKKTAIIFSTHNPLQAERLARHRIYLHQGSVDERPGINRIPISLVQGLPLLRAIAEDAGDRRGRIEPDGLTGISAAASVMIDPEKIRLAPLPQMPPPAPPDPASGETAPLVTAGIMQMSAENGRVRILLDAGFVLTALLPAEAVRRAGIMVGDRVLVGLEPGAVR